MAQENLEGETVDAEDEGWEVFDGYEELFVSIRKNGDISIYSAAYEEFFAECNGVKLLYNDKEDLAAIKPVDHYDEEDNTTYRVTESGSGGRINARRYVKKYEIGENKTKKYECEWNDERGMLIFNPTKRGEHVGNKNSN